MSLADSQAALDRIRSVRDKLDRKFSDFEGSLFREAGAQVALQKDALRARLEDEARIAQEAAGQNAKTAELESAVQSLRESMKVMGGERQDLLSQIQNLERQLKEKNAALEKEPDAERPVLEKNLELFKARVKMLSETAESQAASLQALAREKESLAQRVRELEQSLSSVKPAEQESLRRSFLAVQARRQKSARHWREWMKLYHRQKSRVRDFESRNDEAARHISKLAGELDASQELIAELKDEIRSRGRAPS